jgi:hypothetical protein
MVYINFLLLRDLANKVLPLGAGGGKISLEYITFTEIKCLVFPHMRE